MSLIAEPHVSAQETRPLRGILVAGSGTDVGKTVCTGALLRCLRQENVAVQAVKPVQTGVRADDVASSPLSDAFVYAKAMQGIKSMQGLQPSAVLHCFELPASPHLAAAKENKRLRELLFALFQRAFQALVWCRRLVVTNLLLVCRAKFENGYCSVDTTYKKYDPYRLPEQLCSVHRRHQYSRIQKPGR